MVSVLRTIHRYREMMIEANGDPLYCNAGALHAFLRHVVVKTTGTLRP